MKNIKQKREKLGMTQETLASKLKVTVRTVQRMEKTGKVRHCYLTDLNAILA